MKRLLYWVGLLIGISACVNPKGEEVLAEAERLVQASPDSALLVLEQAEKEVATYPRRNRMRYLLLALRIWMKCSTITSRMAIGTSGCVPAT